VSTTVCTPKDRFLTTRSFTTKCTTIEKLMEKERRGPRRTPLSVRMASFKFQNIPPYSYKQLADQSAGESPRPHVLSKLILHIILAGRAYDPHVPNSQSGRPQALPTRYTKADRTIQHENVFWRGRRAAHVGRDVLRLWKQTVTSYEKQSRIIYLWGGYNEFQGERCDKISELCSSCGLCV
jgi:hypothetical protein